MRALLYCTKSKPYLIKTMGGKYLLSNVYDEQMHNMFGNYYNGKIVAEIEYEIEEIKYHFGYYDMGEWTESYILENSCLTAQELDNYLQASKEYDETKISRVYGYAIKITHCIINWTPRELDDYHNNKDNFITKAPQNMCYVYNDFGRKYVLISVRPEWLAKILNREKTIEIRKKILKEMKYGENNE